MKIDKIFPQLSCVPMYEQTHDDDAAAVMQPENFQGYEKMYRDREE